MKKITYITQSQTNLLSDYANAKQVINTCNALHKNGFSIDLITVNQNKEPNFIKKVHSKHKEILFSIKEIPFHFFFRKQIFYFIFICFKYFYLKNIIYTRSDWIRLFFGFLNKNVIFESHDFKRRATFFLKFFSRKKNIKIITISDALKYEFSKIGFKKNIKTIPDAVDLDRFVPLDKNRTRKLLNIKLDKKIVLYSGALREGRGVIRLIDIASNLPNINFYIFGGRDKKRLEYLNNEAQSLKNVHFFGFIKQDDLILYMNIADIFIMPHQKSCNIINYTSPLKLFEYMSMKRPIIASDFPVFREILKDNISVLFAKSDSTQDFSDKITQILNDRNLSDRLSSNAYIESKKYSWGKRANSILGFIDEKN